MGTTCSITIFNDATQISIVRNLQVIDSASLELGFDCLKYGDGRIIETISDGGETFLDAIAKRINVGDYIEEEMLILLGQLVAETIISVVHRKRPPQVSLRLLSTEPLKERHEISSYLLCGQVAAVLGGNITQPGNMLPFIAKGMAGGLTDRQMLYHLDRFSDE